MSRQERVFVIQAELLNVNGEIQEMLGLRRIDNSSLIVATRDEVRLPGTFPSAE